MNRSGMIVTRPALATAILDSRVAFITDQFWNSDPNSTDARIWYWYGVSSMLPSLILPGDLTGVDGIVYHGEVPATPTQYLHAHLRMRSPRHGLLPGDIVFCHWNDAHTFPPYVVGRNRYRMLVTEVDGQDVRIETNDATKVGGRNPIDGASSWYDGFPALPQVGKQKINLYPTLRWCEVHYDYGVLNNKRLAMVTTQVVMTRGPLWGYLGAVSAYGILTHPQWWIRGEAWQA